MKIMMIMMMMVCLLLETGAPASLNGRGGWGKRAPWVNRVQELDDYEVWPYENKVPPEEHQDPRSNLKLQIRRLKTNARGNI